MLPDHQPLPAGRLRAVLDALLGGSGVHRAQVVSAPGAPRQRSPYADVTPVPFLMVCLEGVLEVRPHRAPAFACQPGDAVLFAPDTWVSTWHARCPRYLRVTCAHDHTFVAMKDSDLQPRGERYIDLHGLVVERTLDLFGQAALRRLLVPETDALAERRARDGVTALLWSVHDLLGPASVGGGHATWLRVRDWVARHLHGPISRSATARAVGVTPWHLARLARRHAGTTFVGFVQDQRLLEAERLLLHSDRTLDEIAQRCQLGSANYLVRCFKARHGETPGRFRARLRR